ncbi:DNA-directed RNA polymerase subunit delta [Priestia endophytica]|uniref:Probable DNA-directed RNA polymerase subunit delta n=1 Tax=Priestia endophytica TaxID=135735 RepID=A0AAX1Q5D4_9BACI|nr:DNA-directed RNA polymerase subunit delta [Priestia endophytica]MCM3540343.1 DNA-directed RNA polymerase subunit delta [Priestia endophytica]RAS73035.1 DNA-directed RNA polymerase subunit delta [Priestia endophytica]RAS89283.1 DNA-directed RNA polymerase subunit delta [Priestia endophytica]
MGLNQYTQEELRETAMIELAFEIMSDSKEPKAFSFHDLVEEIQKKVGLSEAEVRQRIAQFYTDLNIDGRFVTLGDNHWGLRSWYPVDQSEEDLVATVKTKKRKAKRYAKDDLDEFEDAEDDYEEYNDVDSLEDYEELDDEEDYDDMLEEEDYDLDDEDLDDEDLDDEELEYEELDEDEKL